MIAIYYGHRRDTALIEKGLYKPLDFAKKTLMGGLVLVGVGAAVFIALYWQVGLGVWSMAGLVPLFIGIALLIFYPSIKEERGRE